jgi:hypothetical protein
MYEVTGHAHQNLKEMCTAISAAELREQARPNRQSRASGAVNDKSAGYLTFKEE